MIHIHSALLRSRVRCLPALLGALAALTAGLAVAAEPVPVANDAASMAPRVDTSPAAPAPATPAAAPAAAPAPAAAVDAKPRGGKRSAQATTPAPAASGTRIAGKAQDRLDLEATQITGNRELPRVMYVVPWKRPDVGAGPGRPANSLLDEVLAPVDRDVFLRQGRYYEALRPDTPAAP